MQNNVVCNEKSSGWIKLYVAFFICVDLVMKAMIKAVTMQLQYMDWNLYILYIIKKKHDDNRK